MNFHAQMIPSPLLHILLTKLGIWNGMSSLSLVNGDAVYSLYHLRIYLIFSF